MGLYDRVSYWLEVSGYAYDAAAQYDVVGIIREVEDSNINTYSETFDCFMHGIVLGYEYTVRNYAVSARRPVDDIRTAYEVAMDSLSRLPGYDIGRVEWSRGYGSAVGTFGGRYLEWHVHTVPDGPAVAEIRYSVYPDDSDKSAAIFARQQMGRFLTALEEEE